MQKVILYLLSFLASVFGNRYNLNGTTFLEDTEVDFSESFWKLQISALEAAEKKAKNKFKDLN